VYRALSTGRRGPTRDALGLAARRGYPGRDCALKHGRAHLWLDRDLPTQSHRPARERLHATWGLAETARRGPSGNRYADASFSDTRIKQVLLFEIVRPPLQVGTRAAC
jgi:hypothetical protein